VEAFRIPGLSTFRAQTKVCVEGGCSRCTGTGHYRQNIALASLRILFIVSLARLAFSSFFFSVCAVSSCRIFRVENKLTVRRFGCWINDSIFSSCWFALGNGDGNERGNNEVFDHFNYNVNRTLHEAFKPNQAD